VIIVDASLIVEMLRSSPRGHRLRQQLDDDELAAPDILPAEVTSALRGLRLSRQMEPAGTASALSDLERMRIELYPSTPLLARTLELGENLSTYDALYVALAEAFDAPLLTQDRRLATAPGVRCVIETQD